MRLLLHSADAAPLPQQAAAMEIQRFCYRDTQQCRSPLGAWAAATIQEADLSSWAQPKLQSRSEEFVYGGRLSCLQQARSIPGSSTRRCEPKALGRKWHV